MPGWGEAGTEWLQKCHQQGIAAGGAGEDQAEAGGDLQAQQEETEPLQSWGSRRELQ